MKNLNGNVNPKVRELIPVRNDLIYFVQQYLDGIIKARPGNRGAVGVNKEKVRSISEDLSLTGLMTLGLVELSDGTYEFFDGHTRMEGLVRRLNNDLLTKMECNYQLTVMVCHESDRDENYARCNAGIPHNGRMKVTDPSRALGYHGKLFTEKAGVELPAGLHLALWDNIFAARDHANCPILKGLRQARTQITNKIDGLLDKALEARAVILNDQIRKGVDDGLKYHKKVIDHIYQAAAELGNGSNKKVLKELAGQQGLFTVIMADSLSKEPILTKLDPSEIADAAILNANMVIENSQILAKRHTTTVDDVKDFFKYLGVKGSSLNKLVLRFCGTTNQNV